MESVLVLIVFLLCEQEGVIYAVEFSGRELINMAKK